MFTPADSDDMTDVQLQKSNFESRIRVKDMEQFEKRLQKTELREKTKSKEKEVINVY